MATTDGGPPATPAPPAAAASTTKAPAAARVPPEPRYTRVADLNPAGLFNVGRFACPAAPEEVVMEGAELGTLEERHAVMNDIRDGQLMHGYGFLLRWSPAHVRPRDLDAWRLEGDPLADAAVRLLAGVRRGEIEGPEVLRGDSWRSLTSVEQLEMLESTHPAAAAFLGAARVVPAWVDWEAIAVGQQFFQINAAANSLALLNLSLIGGFGAPKINRVLEATGYLSRNRDLTYRRLFETMQMFVDTVPVGAMRVGGGGWRSVLNVRLLHASVRTWLLDSRHWDVAAWGVPINQEDMVITQLAFSAVLLMGLERLGVAGHISDAAFNGYLHLFRYVGHLVGINEAHNTHMGSYRAAQVMVESIATHIVQPDDSSRRIGLHVIDAISYRQPMPRTHHEMVAMTRRLTGDAYADAIGIPRLDDDALYASACARALAEGGGVMVRTAGGSGSGAVSDGAVAWRVDGKLDLLAVAGALLYGGALWIAAMLLMLSHLPRRLATWLRASRGGSGGNTAAAAANEPVPKAEMVAGAVAFAEGAVARLAWVPYITQMPLVGGLVARGIMASIVALMIGKLGGRRSLFPIRLLPRSSPTGAPPSVTVAPDDPANAYHPHAV